MSHGDNDSFWKDSGASVVDTRRIQDVPVYHVTGWYDSWAGRRNLNYVELTKRKKSPSGFLGPWTHGGQAYTYSGIAEFGPEAAIDMNAVRLRWYDHWLKGMDNGVEKDAPVRLFVMGAGEPHKTADGHLFVGGRWRDEQEWPLARAVSTPYYYGDGRYRGQNRLIRSRPRIASTRQIQCQLSAEMFPPKVLLC
jgi:putative CocE/NonD family hydrolase